MFGWDYASLSFVRPPYTCPIMRTSSRPNRSSGLRIGGRLAGSLSQDEPTVDPVVLPP